MDQSEKGSHDAYAALRIGQYRHFVIGRNLSGLGDAMQSVAVGWELYQLSGKPIDLGYVGLVQALPIWLFALHAGHIADRFSRKWVSIIAQVGVCICSGLLAVLSLLHSGLGWFYVVLFLSATMRAFGNPARTALLPQIAPKELLTNAVSWDSSLRRVAVMSGAAMGGWLIALTHHAMSVYLTSMIMGIITIILLALISDPPRSNVVHERASMQTLMAGVHYIWRTPIILATITLDLFAVFLGGATSLLPIFAKDILHVGPSGLGWLRAAPSFGALVTALIIAHMPAFRQPGRAMLWAVAGFGAATIIFGLSRSLPISIMTLIVLGSLDMISVVVRQTLVQTLTPNEMRGRVNAVNSVFINSSNELGGFESGLVAQLFTPVISVVSGGIGSLIVILGAVFMAPSLRSYHAPSSCSKKDSL